MNRRQKSEQKKKKAKQDRLRREKYAAELPLVELSSAETAIAVDPVTWTLSENTNLKIHEPFDDFFLGDEASEWLDTLFLDEVPNWLIKPLWDSRILPHLLLKVSICRQVLVSAEMIAAMRGQHSKYLPVRAAQYIVKQDALISPGLIAFAASAVRRVADYSELRILVKATGLMEKWGPGVEDLIRRLRPESAAGPAPTNEFGFEESNRTA